MTDLLPDRGRPRDDGAADRPRDAGAASPAAARCGSTGASRRAPPAARSGTRSRPRRPGLRRRGRGHRPRRRRRPARRDSRPAARCAAARCGTCGCGWPRTRAGRPGASRRRSRPACSQPADWRAVAITLPDDPGAREQSRRSAAAQGVPSCRRRPCRARLHVTSLGVHEVQPQRRPGRRPPARPGLDRLPAAAARHQPRRHRPARRGRRTCSPAGSATAGTAAGSAGTRRRTAAGTAARSALLAQLEVELPDGSRVTVGTDETWRAATGEVRSADLYDGCADRPAAPPARLGPAGLRRLRLGAGRGRPARPRRSCSRGSRRRSGWCRPSAPSARPRPAAPSALDAGQNVAGVVRLDRPRPGRRHRDRAARRGARAGRRPAHPLAALGQGDRLVRAGRRTTRPCSSRRSPSTASGTPRSTPTPSCSPPRCVAISSDTPPRGDVRPAPTAALTRFHENVAVVPAGQLRRRPDRLPAARRAARLDRRRAGVRADRVHAVRLTLPSGRAGWSTWPTTRPRTARCRASCRTSSATASPRSAGPAGPTRPRSCRGRCTSPTPTPRCWPRSCRACGRWCSYLQGRRQEDGLLGGEFQFGDWLDPDAPGDRPHEAKTSSDYLANAFFAHSARLVGPDRHRARRHRAGPRAHGAR